MSRTASSASSTIASKNLARINWKSQSGLVCSWSLTEGFTSSKSFGDYLANVDASKIFFYKSVQFWCTQLRRHIDQASGLVGPWFVFVRRSQARIPMSRPNRPAMLRKCIKMLRLGNYRTQISSNCLYPNKFCHVSNKPVFCSPSMFL